MDRIEIKLEKIDERLDTIDKHLAVYNQQLKEHIRRTELLETDIIPVKNHVIAVSSISKILGLSSLIVGLILGIMKLVG